MLTHESKFDKVDTISWRKRYLISSVSLSQLASVCTFKSKNFFLILSSFSTNGFAKAKRQFFEPLD